MVAYYVVLSAVIFLVSLVEGIAVNMQKLAMAQGGSDTAPSKSSSELSPLLHR
jgi:hypothetical protein